MKNIRRREKFIVLKTIRRRMGILLIIIIAIGILVVLELFKHHFTKSLFKNLILVLLAIFALLIISAYVDLGSFFSKENTFSQTGQVIAENVGEDLKEIDLKESETLNTIEQKTKDFLKKILDS